MMTTDSPTRRVRFIEDCDGFTANTEYELDPGVADAYVEWRRKAVYAEATENKAILPERKKQFVRTK